MNPNTFMATWALFVFIVAVIYIFMYTKRMRKDFEVNYNDTFKKVKNYLINNSTTFMFVPQREYNMIKRLLAHSFDTELQNFNETYLQAEFKPSDYVESMVLICQENDWTDHVFYDTIYLLNLIDKNSYNQTP